MEVYRGEDWVARGGDCGGDCVTKDEMNGGLDEITLRKAEVEDVPFLYSVYVDPVVRLNSRNQRVPPMAEFRIWILSQPYVFVALRQGISIGFGRYTVREDDTVELSYALGAFLRGKGFGRKLVVALTNEAARRGFKGTFAQVLSRNEPSLKILLQEGYTLHVDPYLSLTKTFSTEDKGKSE